MTTAVRVVQQLGQRNAEFASEKHDYPMLGQQSVFVGQLHYGDFYNRIPKQAFLQGTWRWHPDRSFQDVQRELNALLAKVSRPKNIAIEDSGSLSGRPSPSIRTKRSSTP